MSERVSFQKRRLEKKLSLYASAHASRRPLPSRIADLPARLHCLPACVCALLNAHCCGLPVRGHDCLLQTEKLRAVNDLSCCC